MNTNLVEIDIDQQLFRLRLCKQSSTTLTMRLVLLLLAIFIACATSRTERDCGKDPDDCNLALLHVNDCRNPKNVSDHKGVDQEVLDNIRLFSQFAAAAYWPGNNNSTGDLLRCSGPSCPKVPAGNCPDVEKAEYMAISEWEDMAGFDDHGKRTWPREKRRCSDSRTRLHCHFPQ